MRSKHLWVFDTYELMHAILENNRCSKRDFKEIIELIIYCRLDALRMNLLSYIHSDTYTIVNASYLFDEFILDGEDDSPLVLLGQTVYEQFNPDAKLWEMISYVMINDYEIRWFNDDLVVEVAE